MVVEDDEVQNMVAEVLMKILEDFRSKQISFYLSLCIPATGPRAKNCGPPGPCG